MRRLLGASALALALAPFAVPACATSVEVAGDEALTGSAALEAAGCSLCDVPNECSGCIVQGFALTFRCPADGDVPETGCAALGESHLDAVGERYGCFYCDE
ncbi:MAG: hypothetical protein HY908_36815 [Myxococcales bacterium]|nr:hypothetical protein [Myxococcales bacterium]